MRDADRDADRAGDLHRAVRRVGRALAVGLARGLWPRVRREVTLNNRDPAPVARLFEMSWEDANAIFYRCEHYDNAMYLQDVTPGMVADARTLAMPSPAASAAEMTPARMKL